jgi:CHAT domain-containing protein
LQAIRAATTDSYAQLPLLGIGDVPYDDLLNSQADGAGVKIRVLRGLYDLAGVRLKNIPETRQEVLSIGNVVGNDAILLLGPDATESRFKSQPLRDFKVIHIATHAIAETEIPERAALVLGRSQSSQDDGLLQVREITQMQLRADLVTLSACNTGVGILQGEAGASTIQEAFLVAGAKSVVASLWPVDDTYTTALMIRFYERLAAGEEKSVALRHTKLDMLEKYGRDVPPFYWAAFVLTGDGASAISLRSRSVQH